VLIQTLNSESEVFLHAQKGSLNSFYEKELERRKIVDFPPYAKVISLYFHSRFQERAMQSATLATDLLIQMITTHFGQVKVMGPRPSLMEKRAGMYSWCLILKSSSVTELHQVYSNFEQNFKVPQGVRLKVDVDPLAFS
nr:hypothetical protein [Bacteriovoracaceae bacterium]